MGGAREMKGEIAKSSEESVKMCKLLQFRDSCFPATEPSLVSLLQHGTPG